MDTTRLPGDASFPDAIDLTCSACGSVFEASTWLIVDASARPELILDDQLFSPACPHCGQVEELDYPLLLYLPDADPCLLFSPPPGWEQIMVQDQVIELVKYLHEPLGEAWREEWLDEDLPVLRHELLASAVEQPHVIDSILEIEALLQQASDATDAYEHDGDLGQLGQATRIWTWLWEPRLMNAVTADFRLCLLNDGAHAHLLRYWALGDTEDLRLALDGWGRVVLETPPGAAQRPGRLSNLGNGLIQSYLLTGEHACLERAIALQREAIVTSDPDSPPHARYLSNLASGLGLRHARNGARGDLDEASALLREALQSIDGDSVDRPGLLCNLGGALLARFEQYGAPGDLEEAVPTCEAALQESSRSSDTAAMAHNLGRALWRRYQQTGRRADLHRAIRHLRQATALTPTGAWGHALYMDSLGSVLSDLYDATGDLDDLKAALETYRSVGTEPAASPIDQADYLSHRGSALIALYCHQGDGAMLAEAVGVCHAAVSASQPDAPGRVKALHNLATALSLNYGLTGQLHDLEEAIALLEEAVEGTPPGNPDRHAHLSNLANALLRLYERRSQEEDLDRCIASYEMALQQARPGAPVRSGYLSNLASALSVRYRLHKDLQNVARRLELHIETLKATLDDSPHRAGYLGGLGTAYLDLYETSGSEEDLQRAVEVLEQAIQGAATSSTLPGHLYNHGLALSHQYRTSHDKAYLSRAMGAYRDACTGGLSSLPGVVLDASRAWSEMALREGAWQEAAEACEYGLEAAERIYRAQLRRGHKHTWLGAARGIAANGAYALAHLGQVKQAILMLESDRARLLSEALERDSADLGRLQETDPEHYARYLTCVERLRWLEAKDLANEKRLATGQSLRDALVSAHEELNTIVKEIRRQPGQASFLVPLDWQDLTPALEHAPLVYIAYTAIGGVALLAWSADDVSLVWLNDLTRQNIEAQMLGDTGAGGYAAAYRAFRERGSRADWAAWRNALSAYNDWLARVVLAPLIAALRERSATEAALIPTGLLALLPLQAVASDLSFALAPNARILARNVGMAEASRSGRALIVSDPNPGGTLGLPFSVLEVVALKESLPSAEHLHVEGDEAKRKHVLEALSSYSVWHLATHGYADWHDALDSFLLLAHEERIMLRDLLSLRTEAALAVLSACETGLPELGLPDEAISLATGMLQAGVRCVVSSFWPVHDLSTALLMSHFYRELAAGENGLASVAVALHAAQRWLKELSLEEARAVLVEWMADPSISPDLCDQLLGQFTALDRRGQHPFAHPYYWAGFQAHGVAFC